MNEECQDTAIQVIEKYISLERRMGMKRLMVVVMAVMALMGLLTAPVFAGPNDKLVVMDAGGVNPVFVVQNTGLVGVGTATPVSNLNIVGPVFPAFKTTRQVSFTSGGRGVAAFELQSTATMADGFGPSFEFWISDSGFTANRAIVSLEAVRDGSNQAGAFILRNGDLLGNLNVSMYVDHTGKIGFGGAIPGINPIVVGTNGSTGNGAYLSAGGTWTNGSSREFKEDIAVLSAQDAMETVRNLQPVKYAYKVDPTERHVGFIAEDVPDLVATRDRKHLSPMDIVAVLTKVVQEQSKTIEALSAKVEKIEKAAKESKGF